MSQTTPTDAPQNTAFFRRPLDNARISISRLSSSPDDIAEIFKGVCQITANALSVERVGIWLYVDNRSSIRCITLYERSKAQFSEGATLRVCDFPNYFAGLKVRRTLGAENANCDPKTNELEETYLRPLGITSMLDAPILVDGEVVGVVCNEHVGIPREWTTEERDFAGSVADLTALKLKGAEIGRLRQIIRDLDSDRAAKRQRETLECMAAGAAHDFRNFLLIIVSYASEIKALAGDNSNISEFSSEILRAAERGKALTDELMQVGQERACHPRVINLADHLNQFLSSLTSVLTPEHELELDAEQDSGRVFIEPAQLDRIIMNLVINARDAMKSGGRITIRVRGSRGEKGGHVTLSVKDTGHGMTPEIINRIFDPFFTTKARGSGTGLGLFIVREAIEQAGGSLHVESQPGQGSTFFIQLPRVSASSR